ncbi:MULTISPECIES: winged helix-turn-helix domain-containing protein [Nocardiopsis]|uniref:winged helix-turn-helix domain-containing protein n=1 Tax=Nocardiopsis TaxID=2013 RepID=UPI0004760F5F|nr:MULTISPECIES: winged helix-turn-helix domain-containing protein [Nocardiopsis]PWV55204.1 helix-turn-helix protein [Nocardiopsis sp. L17-MgMaSL7]
MAEPAPEPTARRQRRRATAREAKALGHPLRLRILRLCLIRDRTNRELADRLDTNPGTVLHHVRTLVDVGFLVAGPVRKGAAGALEKPYRATGETWWLDDPLRDTPPAERTSPLTAFTTELDEAGPDSVQIVGRFALHLDDEELSEFNRRLLDVVDEYVTTDHERRDRPLRGGALLWHDIPED